MPTFRSLLRELDKCHVTSNNGVRLAVDPFRRVSVVLEQCERRGREVARDPDEGLAARRGVARDGQLEACVDLFQRVVSVVVIHIN